MMYSFNNYHYKLEWSWIEQCYVASVQEFINLHTRSTVASNAMYELEQTVATRLRILKEKGQLAPLPITYESTYGRL